MKKLVYVLLCCGFLISCHSGKPEILSPSVKSETGIPDSSKQRLIRIITGGWVNESYIFSLFQSHSPMMAASHGLPFQQLTFESSNLNGDTLLNAVSRLSFNEGQQFDVLFYRKENGTVGMKAMNNRNLLSTAHELDFRFTERDTVLLLDYQDGAKKMQARFRRVFRDGKSSDNITLTALEYFVNQNLFEGNWDSPDGEISFSPSGQVKGFRDFKRFAVTTMEDHPASKADEISFYNDSAGVTWVFTMDQSVMRLYEMKESEDGKYFTRGKLIYEMTHQ